MIKKLHLRHVSRVLNGAFATGLAYTELVKLGGGGGGGWAAARTPGTPREGTACGTAGVERGEEGSSRGEGGRD